MCVCVKIVVVVGRGGGQFNRNNSNNIQTSIYRNLEPTEHPLMPTKVLITYRHFLVFARHTYLHLKKKFRVIGNGGIPIRTLTMKFNYLQYNPGQHWLASYCQRRCPTINMIGT